MTWHPLQAALKMSTIPGAIRGTLDVLLDHINADPQDPSRPATLTVWESRERLAAEAGFSEVTTRDHLQRLCGEKDLRKGQRVTVLRCIEPAQSHRAARYELIPEALDALVDPERLEAFEATPPRETHPYQRWRQWRTAQMAQGELGVSSLPQDTDDTLLGVSSLPSADEIGESCLPQLGQAAFPELPVVDLDTEELTIFLPSPASTPPEKKARGWSQSPTKTKTLALIETPAPDDLAITPALEAWRDEHAPGLDLRRAIKKFLLYTRTKGTRNADWTAALCFYILNGQDQQAARYQEQQAALAQHREASERRMQAEEDAQAAKLPGGADAWANVRELRDGFYGTHVGGCGEPHQCDGPCPTHLQVAAD
jgi:hypothetical protein